MKPMTIRIPKPWQGADGKWYFHGESTANGKTVIPSQGYATLQKAEQTRSRLAGAVISLVSILMVAILCGCASNKKVDALLASTQEQAKRAATTEAVMLELAKRSNGVIPDTIASVEPGSMVGWAIATRCIRDETNKPLLDKNGNAQMETMQAIGKSRSGREFGDVKRGRLKLAGMAYNFETAEIDPNALLEGSSLEIQGTAGGSTVNTDWAKVWGDAIAGEKSVVLAGMAKLATDRGAAFAVKVKALTDGTANIVTATGAIVAQVLKTTVVPVPTDLMSAGITKIVRAVTRTTDGNLVDILAADTATSENATEAIKAETAEPVNE